MMLMSYGVLVLGSSVPMTWSSTLSAPSLLPRFFGPAKPGALTGITGLPNFSAARAHTASMSSPISAVTQVW